MLDEIIDLYGGDGFLIADGFNEAIIGYDSIGRK